MTLRLRTRFVAASSGGGGSDTLVWTQSLKNDSGSTASGQRIRFTGGALEGVIPDTSVLELRKSDGATAITRQQFDAIAYHDDGSVRFFVCTFEQQDNIAGSGTDTVKVYSAPTTAASNTSAITDQNLKDLDYTVECAAGGTTYEFDIAAAITAGDFRDFAVGPAERQIRAFGLMNNGGTPKQELFCIAFVGLLRDGTTSHATAHVISNWDENYTTRSAAGTGAITAILIKKAGSSVKSHTISSFDMSGGMGTRVLDDDATDIWSANKPTVRPVYDSQQETALLRPHYMNHSGFVTALGSPSSRTYSPLVRASVEADLNATGPRADIGWMPGWNASYAITMNAAWARESRVVSAATLHINKNFYNSTYGEPLVARNQTYGSIVGNANISTFSGDFYKITPAAGTDLFFDNNMSHWPQAPYFQYVCTGEPWWLEEAVVDACHGVTSNLSTQRARTHTNGDTQTSTVRNAGGPRGWAWAYNTICNAAHVVPDSHPLHDYIIDVRDDCTAYMNSISKAANNPTKAAALGIPILFIADSITDGDGVDGISWSQRWFMQAYVGVVTAFAYRRGLFAASDAMIANTLDKCYLGAGLDGCVRNSFGYTMNFSYRNVDNNDPSNIAEAWVDVCTEGTVFNGAATGGILGTGTYDDNVRVVPSTGCPTSGTNTPFGIYMGSNIVHWHAFACIMHDAGWARGTTYKEAIDVIWDAAAISDSGLANAAEWCIRSAA